MKILDRVKSKPLLAKSLAILLTVGTLASIGVAYAAQKSASIVILNANWCASCREVIPVVREIAGQNRLSIVEIDIDVPSAPSMAKDYGITISSNDPPQVYYVNKNQVVLLYDGRGYKYGQSDTVRTTILNKLQQQNSR